MANQEKVKRTYTKDMLIKRIANECHDDLNECRSDLKMIRIIYDSLEKDIFDILSSADPNTDTSIRLFEGISLCSTFVPEKTKVNNLTGETIIASSKIKPKANITRNYCEKLTSHNK